MDISEAVDLLAKGKAGIARGDWDGSSKLLAKAKSLLERSKLDDEGRKVLLDVLKLKSHSDTRRGQTRLALQCLTEALELSRSLGDLENEAELTRRLGHLTWIHGGRAKASKYFQEAQLKAKKAGAQLVLGRILIDLGNMSVGIGDHDESIKRYKEAERILLGIGDISELPRLYNNLGTAYISRAQYKEAVEMLKKGLAAATRSGNALIGAMVQLNSAECHLYLGEFELAKSLLEAGTKTMEEFDDKPGLVSSYRIHGLMYTELKDWPKAETFFRKALALVKVSDFTETEGTINYEYGKMFLAKGDKGRAKEKLEAALSIFTKLGIPQARDDAEAALKRARS